jgi:hypothetical protein
MSVKGRRRGLRGEERERHCGGPTDALKLSLHTREKAPHHPEKRFQRQKEVISPYLDL